MLKTARRKIYHLPMVMLGIVILLHSLAASPVSAGVCQAVNACGG